MQISGLRFENFCPLRMKIAAAKKVFFYDFFYLVTPFKLLFAPTSQSPMFEIAANFFYGEFCLISRNFVDIGATISAVERLSVSRTQDFFIIEK